MRQEKPQRRLRRERLGDSRAPGMGRLSQRLTSTRPSPVLTPRQRDVALLLVGTGLSYKEIAARLDVSEGTIRTHTERIYRAVGVHSRSELTAVLRGQEHLSHDDRLGMIRPD